MCQQLLERPTRSPSCIDVRSVIGPNFLSAVGEELTGYRSWKEFHVVHFGGDSGMIASLHGLVLTRWTRTINCLAEAARRRARRPWSRRVASAALARQPFLARPVV